MQNMLIGHQDVYSYFAHLRLDHLPSHAFLFAGPQSVGKRSCADLLVQEWLCTGDEASNASLFESSSSGNAEKPCGQCTSCRSLQNGLHPDRLFLQREEGKHLISIEQIRTVIGWLYRAPTQAAKKFLIVDDAHELSPAAANAFLKTLEEPPSSVVIFLISHRPDSLPKTILSRVQRIEFGFVKESGEAPDSVFAQISEGRPGRNTLLAKDKQAVEKLTEEVALFNELVHSTKGKRLLLLEGLFTKRSNHAGQKQLWNERLLLWERLLGRQLHDEKNTTIPTTKIVQLIDYLADVMKNERFHVNLRANLEQFCLLF